MSKQFWGMAGLEGMTSEHEPVKHASPYLGILCANILLGPVLAKIASPQSYVELYQTPTMLSNR